MAHKHRARTYDTRTEEDNKWRKGVSQALDTSGYFAEAFDFAKCGDPTCIFHYVVCKSDPTHFAKPIPHTCKLRICPECAHRESARLLKRYMPHIRRAVKHGKKRYRLRHIILTAGYDVRHPEAKKQYRKLWKSVSKLFDTLLGKGWTKTGQGYIPSCEFGEHGHKLHFHILFFGEYLEQRRISQVWEKLTTWKVVYIREVKNPKKAASEVLKYCCKLTELDPHDIPCLLEIIKGSRRIRSRGIFYNLPKEPQQPATCEECGSHLTLMGKSTYEFWKAFHDEEADRQLLEDEPAPGRDQLHLILGNKSPPKLPGFEGYEPRPIYF